MSEDADQIASPTSWKTAPIPAQVATQPFAGGPTRAPAPPTTPYLGSEAASSRPL